MKKFADFSFAQGIALIQSRSFEPGSFIKSTSRDGSAHWTLTNSGALTYTNRNGETRPATVAEVIKLINSGYTTRL